MADVYTVMMDRLRQEAQGLEQCPKATQDINLNMRHRQDAINQAKYGPANPQLDESGGNKEFWDSYANKFRDSVENVMTMRCGNCTFFNRTPPMLRCIKKGLGPQGDPETAIEGGELGYCPAWDFKCASMRTCFSWASKQE